MWISRMRYYFDIFNGSVWARDDFGMDCANDRLARQQAIMALLEMASEELPGNGEVADFRIRVREGKAHRFTAKLNFELVMLGRP
jgi:hypothetical protein